MGTKAKLANVQAKIMDAKAKIVDAQFKTVHASSLGALFAHELRRSD